MSSPSIDLRNLKKHIIKNFDTSLKGVADTINYGIEMAYRSAIDAFYNHYTPDYYNRTYSTYDASDNSDQFGLDKKYNSIKIGNMYEAGIAVDPDNIIGNPYRARDKSWVFSRTFEKGYHGITTREMKEWGKKKVKIEVVTPIIIDGKKYKKIVGFLNRTTNRYHYYSDTKYAVTIIRNGVRYSNAKRIHSLRYQWYTKENKIRAMKPTPDDIVTKYWENVRKPRYVQSMLDAYIFSLI